jgi:ferric-dicitrate binding protein FerR (iron transport regulator)
MKTTENDTQISRDTIAEQAAEWLLLIEDDHNVKVQAEFQLWLKKSDSHKQIFAEHQAIWSSADSLTLEMFEHDLASLPLGRQSKEAPCQILAEGNNNQLQTNKLNIFASIREFFTLNTFRYSIAAVSSFALILVLVAQLPLASLDNVEITQSSKPALQEYHTQLGEHKSIVISDGSIIAMSGKTRIKVDFKDKQRNIYLLEGEALFTVAKDKTRPFIVHNQNRSFQALGTIFNVRESKSLAEIKVLEGIVEVKSLNTAQNETAILNAGEAVKVENSGVFSTKSNINITDAMSWQQRRMNYISAELGDVIFDLKRYSNLNIYIQDQQVSLMKYTGRLVYDNAEDWLTALPYVFSVEVQRHGDTVVISKREDR